jgi:hypothetical protein
LQAPSAPIPAFPQRGKAQDLQIGVKHAAPREVPLGIREEMVHRLLRRLGRPAGHVRREQDVVQAHERFGPLGFALVDIDTGARDAVLAQRGAQRLGVDHAAAADAHEVALGPQRIEHFGVDQVPGRGPARRGKDQEIRPGRERLQVVEVAVRRAFARLPVVIADLHVERGGALGDLLADGAQAQDAELLARHVGRLRNGLAPHAFAAQPVELAELAHDADEQAEGVVGHAVVVGAGAVGGHDAAGARHLERHAFIARAQAADQLHGRHGRDFLGGDADHADGQHRAECLAALGNGGRARGGVEGVGHVVDLGNLGLVGAREAVEHQQGNLGRHV